MRRGKCPSSRIRLLFRPIVGMVRRRPAAGNPGMGKMRLQWLGVFAAAILVGLAPAPRAEAEPIAVEVRAVPLDTAAPERTTLGPLRYRGGIEIRSTDRRFGGLSGLAVSADGTRFVAVADFGYWFTGTLVYDGGGRLVGIADPSIEPLRDERPSAQRQETGRCRGDRFRRCRRLHRRVRAAAPARALCPGRRPGTALSGTAGGGGGARQRRHGSADASGGRPAAHRHRGFPHRGR